MGAPILGPLTFMWQIWTEFPVTGRCKHLGSAPEDAASLSQIYTKNKTKQNKQANKNPQNSTNLCETYYYAHKQQPITITKML